MVMMNNLKKFYSILSEDHKKKLIYIIIFSFIGALLEMISLGLIIPIIGFLNSETLVNNYFINNTFVSFSSFLKNLIIMKRRYL